MAAKKQNQQSQSSEAQKPDAPQQQELAQGDQQQENQGQAPEAKPDVTNGPADQGGDAAGSTSDPDPATTPDPGDSEDQDSDLEQEVFVLVDHNPLGLKCATVATMPASQAARLEKQGIVDTAEAAVARGKANRSGAAGGDQVIEDND